MRRLFYFMVCFAACSELSAFSFEAVSRKEKIETLQSAVKNASEEQRGQLLISLAVAYQKDQNLEKAFQTYLEVLNNVVEEPRASFSDEEQKIYQEALALYLKHAGVAEAREEAKQIYRRFAPILDTHPEYYTLNFLVAAAAANLEKFDEFFERFYLSYRHFPNHYMAFRTKAILYTKLFSMARTPQDREQLRGAILENGEQAIKRNPHDTALYKMILTFSPEQQKERALITCLNKIIDENIIIPRAEIPFFVRQAVSCRQSDLARRFLNKAHQWYPQSKIIDTAQEQLKLLSH